MPCYTAWYEHLEPDTPEYAAAIRVVAAKLHAVKHIVSHYYRVFGCALPKIPDRVELDNTRQPRSRKEQKVRELICHHFACDKIHFTTLYDVCSLLDERIDDDKSYLAVIGPCAHLMRSEYRRFHPEA